MEARDRLKASAFLNDLLGYDAEKRIADRVTADSAIDGAPDGNADMPAGSPSPPSQMSPPPVRPAGQPTEGTPVKVAQVFPDPKHNYTDAEKKKNIHELEEKVKQKYANEISRSDSLITRRFKNYMIALQEIEREYAAAVSRQKDREEYVLNCVFTIAFFFVSAAAIEGLAAGTVAAFSIEAAKVASLRKGLFWRSVEKAADAAAQDGKKLYTKQGFKAGRTVTTTMLSLTRAMIKRLPDAEFAVSRHLNNSKCLEDIAGIYHLMQVNDYHTFSSGLRDYMDKFEKEAAPIICAQEEVVSADPDCNATNYAKTICALIYYSKDHVYYAQVQRLTLRATFVDHASYSFVKWIDSALSDDIPDVRNSVKLHVQKDKEIFTAPSGAPPETSRAVF